MKKLSASIFFMLVFPPLLHATDKYSRPSEEIIIKLIDSNVVVGFSWVDMPVNQILLIKNKEVVCGIKFISFERNNDAKEQTVFNSGDETVTASYKIVEYKNNQLELEPSHVNLKRNPTVGVGRINFQTGKTTIDCGESKLLWRFPTGVMLFGKDFSTFLKPTQHSNFSKALDIDQRFEWIGYDEARQITIIPNIL